MKFIIKSTNQHGVHSPFVYDLVTKCFYDRKEKEWDQQLKKIYYTDKFTLKHSRLLVRLLDYFNIRKVLLLGDISDSLVLIFKISSSTKLYKKLQNTDQYDLIYFEAKHIPEDINMLSEIFTKIHNDSIIILPGIHYDQTNKNLWKSIINHPQVTVTIDSYYFGFVFFRKQQAKEHFVIRL